MNKFLCKETKKRNKFKRVMCGMCNHASRCESYRKEIIYEEDKHTDKDLHPDHPDMR